MIEDLVHDLFRAFQEQDRAAIDALFADNFRFTSPRDESVDKAQWFERCFPNSKRIDRFELEKIFTEGNELFVRYTARRVSDGVRFRNTEFWRIENGKIAQVDVYFGRDVVESRAC